ncbi:MAG: BCD family MFS transporter [Anaerolineae bacterium]|jgi:BCD family chlorophyll transporter-like MFS transporter
MTVHDVTLEKTQKNRSGFSVLRSFKLGSFHIGSSMTDVLLSGVWNRVMITDLGIAAWPVSLLLALRYFLAPLAIWAGHESDTHPIRGSRRTAYIWLGRLLMLIALPLLPLSVGLIAESDAGLGWMLAVISLLLYGTGTSISGAPFLALVHDSAPYERRGQVVSIVQFMLVVSFAFIPVLFARIMPHYDQALFWQLVIVGMVGAAFFWIISVLGEERRARRINAAPATLPAGAASLSLRASLTEVWSDRRIRRYAIFLGASAFFAFMQDAVLEPFGGDVFGLSAGETTRFNAYWGTGVLISMIVTYALTRRRRPDQQVSTTAWGLLLLSLGVALLSVAAMSESLAMIMPVLIFFGIGFGVFTVGGISLLMAVNTVEKAASYLAIWSVIQLVNRGLGIAAGGLLRDLVNTLTGQIATAYAVVFAIEAIGLVLCIWLLRRVDISGFAAEHRTGVPAEPVIPSFD